MFNRVRSLSVSSADFAVLLPDFDAEQLPTELRELHDSWAASADGDVLNSGPAAESDWPVAIFVPERYEERYAYPLIIWFHGDDSSEDQLEDVMIAISQQNYCGLALRANQHSRSGDGYGWNFSGAQFGAVTFSELLQTTTCRLRRAFHIHSERIFLAGSGSGADAALQILARHPDWFAGTILLDPAGDPEALKAERLTALRGKPLLQTVSRRTSNEQLARNVETVRLLRSAGASVQIELTDRVTDPTSADVRFLDQWIMDQMRRAALV